MIERVRGKGLHLVFFVVVGLPLTHAATSSGPNAVPFSGRPHNCAIFLRQLNFTEVSPEVFFGVVSELKDKPFLRKRSLEEYIALHSNNGRLYLSQDRLLGYGISGNGLLVSVFNHTHTPGMGAFGVFNAIDHQARALVCVDDRLLREFYESCGFRVDHTFDMQPENAGYDYPWPRGVRPQMLYMILP